MKITNTYTPPPTIIVREVFSSAKVVEKRKPVIVRRGLINIIG